MKSHLCSEEGTMISFEGECNWCGAKETVLPKLTDEVIGDLWHQSGCHLHKFAKMLREWLKENAS